MRQNWQKMTPEARRAGQVERAFNILASSSSERFRALLRRWLATYTGDEYKLMTQEVKKRWKQYEEEQAVARINRW